MRVQLRNGYTQAYATKIQHTHTQKAVTRRVEAKQLLSRRRQSNYSNNINVWYKRIGFSSPVCFSTASTALWTEWSPWSSCSVTCGDGTQTSKRTCSDPGETGGSCDESQETSKTQQCRSGQCRKIPKHVIFSPKVNKQLESNHVNCTMFVFQLLFRVLFSNKGNILASTCLNEPLHFSMAAFYCIKCRGIAKGLRGLSPSQNPSPP